MVGGEERGAGGGRHVWRAAWILSVALVLIVLLFNVSAWGPAVIRLPRPCTAYWFQRIKLLEALQFVCRCSAVSALYWHVGGNCCWQSTGHKWRCWSVLRGVCACVCTSQSNYLVTMHCKTDLLSCCHLPVCTMRFLLDRIISLCEFQCPCQLKCPSFHFELTDFVKRWLQIIPFWCQKIVGVNS